MTIAEKIIAFAERFSAGQPASIAFADHANISGDDGLPIQSLIRDTQKISRTDKPAQGACNKTIRPAT